MALAGIDVPLTTQVRRERAALDAVRAARKVVDDALRLCRYADLDPAHVLDPLDASLSAVGGVVVSLTQSTP